MNHICRGVNPAGNTGDTFPIKVCVGASIALPPPKLSEDTSHVGHTWDMSHYSQH